MREEFQLERRFVDRKQTFDHVRVVLEVAVQFGLTRFVSAKEASVFHQLRCYELGVADRDLSIVVPPKNVRRFSERRQYKPVPGGKGLVITARSHPLFARIEKLSLASVDCPF